MRYSQLADVIAEHNAVPQELSSSTFTTDLREAEPFTSAAGSDSGIANVNDGPSGAEIGGTPPQAHLWQAGPEQEAEPMYTTNGRM